MASTCTLLQLFTHRTPNPAQRSIFPFYQWYIQGSDQQVTISWLSCWYYINQSVIITEKGVPVSVAFTTLCVCQESCLQTSTALLLTALPVAQHSHIIAITPWHVPGSLPSPSILIRHTAKAVRSQWRFSLEPAQAFGLLPQHCRSKQKSAAAVISPLPPRQSWDTSTQGLFSLH